MRYTYLNEKTPGATDTCRGGVSSRSTQHHNGEFILEIGNSSQCSPKMLAFCAFMDEIEELLCQNINSELVDLVMLSWWNLEKELTKSLVESRKKRNQSENPN
jgi:hypothetical protein